jgi:hypothetical protein
LVGCATICPVRPELSLDNSALVPQPGAIFFVQKRSQNRKI